MMKALKHIYTCLFIFTLLSYAAAQHPEQSLQGAKSVLDKVFEEKAAYDKARSNRIFPDVLADAQNEHAAFLKSLLGRLAIIDLSVLSVTDRINYEVFTYVLKDEVDRVALEEYLIPFNAEGGFYNSLTFRVNRQFQSGKSYRDYNKMLAAYPQYMRDNMQLMSTGMEKGKVSPRLIAANYQVLIAPFLEKAGEGHLLLSPYQQPPVGVSPDSLDYFKSETFKLIQEAIIPAYQAFDRFMKEEYLPATRDGIGIAEIPDGRNLYEQRIAFYTSLPLKPVDVFEKGQAEVVRIRKEMEGIIAETGFEGDFTAFLEFLRTDPQFYHTEPRALLMEAAYLAKRIDGLLPRYFKTLPRLPYGITPVPASIAPNYTAGRYSSGSYENHRAGQYWVNTYKLESRPLYALPALTLHEAVPGHHLQMALAQEQEGLPEFRNSVYLSAFGEGWALYTEFLGKEMGIYTTPYEHFGRMTYEMWRACRLVVDVGMHYYGWSREKALDFLSSNTALSLHECETEINRYIGWPGQAVSYKIGELTIRELRHQAEQALGAAFDLREFHDVVLRNGSIPLYVLKEVVQDYIDGKQGG